MQNLIDALKTIQGYGLTVMADGGPVVTMNPRVVSGSGSTNIVEPAEWMDAKITVEDKRKPKPKKRRKPLTAAKVRQIKRALKGYAAIYDIAKRFDVSTSVVYGIESGRTWAKVKA